jgi:hypothetical protein
MEKIINPINQVTAAPNLSQTYGFISSQEILETFKSKGWYEDSRSIANVRKVEKQGFQKHLVCLKNPSLPLVQGLSKNNESEIRLYLLNSHDGTTRLSAFMGVMRVACLNQLLAGGIFRYFHAVHSQNIVKKLSEGIEYVTEGIPQFVNELQKLQNIQLDTHQRFQIANEVIKTRFENTNNLVSFDASTVEQVVRPEDSEHDAYTVLNRLQEKLIRGGIPFTYAKNVYDSDGKVIDQIMVSTKTRKVTSISQQIKLNKVAFEAVSKVG